MPAEGGDRLTVRAPRVLLVDDEADFVRFLARFVAERFPDALIQTATGPSEALRALSEGAFDLVVCDHALSRGGEDGITLLTRVAEIQPEAGRVLLTGFADLEIALRAINEGHVHAFLEKPLHGDVVVAAFERVLAEPRTATSEPHGEILLVEDDPDLRRLVVRYFGIAMPGVHVDAVPTAREGLEHVATRHVDVILADYHLPDMTGSQFLRKARRDAPDARTAIITGSPPRGLSDDVRSHVADRLFIKPMEMGAFARAVRHLLPEEGNARRA